jgi:hypothetical protein
MRAYRSLAMGSLRSHWDFYFGFSLFLSANHPVLGAVLEVFLRRPGDDQHGNFAISRPRAVRRAPCDTPVRRLSQ